MLPEILLKRFEDISLLPENWTSYRCCAPNPSAIKYAKEWLEGFHSDIASSWRDPNICADESGNVSMEWWNGRKVLTFYVDAYKIDYLTSWGTDINDEMFDGDIIYKTQPTHIWQWFIADDIAPYVPELPENADRVAREVALAHKDFQKSMTLFVDGFSYPHNDDALIKIMTALKTRLENIRRLR